MELFDYAAANPPANDQALTALEQWLENADFPDISLPEEFLAFLRESNGGDFVKNGREFQMLSAEEIPEYYDAYNFARFMPYALPFAMDGNGNFYIFNKREKDGRVYSVSAGNLGWDECELISNSFTDCLKFPPLHGEQKVL